MDYNDYIKLQVEEIRRYYNDQLEDGKEITLDRAAFEWVCKYAEDFSRKHRCRTTHA